MVFLILETLTIGRQLPPGRQFFPCSLITNYYEIEGPIFVYMSFYEATKWILEQVPHFSQCILLATLAVERYILVCYPSGAKTLLSRKKRTSAFVFVTLLLLACSSVSVIDLVTDYIHRRNTYPVRQKQITKNIWTDPGFKKSANLTRRILEEFLQDGFQDSLQDMLPRRLAKIITRSYKINKLVSPGRLQYYSFHFMRQTVLNF